MYWGVSERAGRGGEPAKRRALGGVGGSLGAFAGLCFLQANSHAMSPGSCGAAVVSFCFIAKAGFACCTAWETWQSGLGDCIAALPVDWRELLGFHITATAAA